MKKRALPYNSGFMMVCAACGMLAALALAAPQFTDAQVGGRGRFRGGGMRGGIGEGRPGPEEIGAYSPIMADLEQMKARGLFPTGLRPVYPEKAECPAVTSPFGSQRRGDGSWRNERFYNGYHGGLDIPAPEGTPILAIAGGTVIRKKEGRGIGGVGIMLQHSPEDTGLPAWTYTEYKHLREMPKIPIGQRVRMGEVIAYAGNTGTKGGHYGVLGFSHLHLTAFFSPGSKFWARRIFVPIGGQWMDPLALFKGGTLQSAKIRDLPDDKKWVKFAYKTTDGKLAPDGSKVVWPFACKPR
ncbi:MAG TPA: hypothetical protein DDZ83_00615 [Nitrospinae bacterium]|nr:hypothetical protein [Nitrospinota bacterium]